MHSESSKGNLPLFTDMCKVKSTVLYVLYTGNHTIT
jgi:hypothetical protein